MQNLSLTVAKSKNVAFAPFLRWFSFACRACGRVGGRRGPAFAVPSAGPAPASACPVLGPPGSARGASSVCGPVPPPPPPLPGAVVGVPFLRRPLRGSPVGGAARPARLSAGPVWRLFWLLQPPPSSSGGCFGVPRGPPLVALVGWFLWLFLGAASAARCGAGGLGPRPVREFRPCGGGRGQLTPFPARGGAEAIVRR